MKEEKKIASLTCFGPNTVGNSWGLGERLIQRRRASPLGARSKDNHVTKSLVKSDFFGNPAAIRRVLVRLNLGYASAELSSSRQ